MARVEVTSGDLDEDASDLVDRLEAEGSFGYRALYAEWVNNPTQYTGSPPPFKPLRKWTHRKWTDLDAGLKEAAFREGMTVEEHKDAVANMVRFAIAENGTEGVYFMERAIERARSNAEAIAAPYENSEDPDAGYHILVDLLDYAFGQSQDIVAEEATDTGTLLQSGYVSVEQLVTGDTYEETGGSGP